MPDFSSNDPRLFGWSYPVSPVPFRWRQWDFPAGCHPAVVGLFTHALDRLAAASGFQMHSGTPGQAGTWGYEDRPIRGGTDRSFHAYGLALDVNAPWNPRGGIPAATPWRLPTWTDQLMRPLGILWGGAPEFGSNPDWMHIEVHATPQEVVEVVAGLPAGGHQLVPFPLPPGSYYGPYSGPNESVSGVPASDARWRGPLALAQHALHVPADGRYGPVTAAAVRAFQGRHQLEVDGLIGPRTWAALFSR